MTQARCQHRLNDLHQTRERQKFSTHYRDTFTQQDWRIKTLDHLQSWPPHAEDNLYLKKHIQPGIEEIIWRQDLYKQVRTLKDYTGRQKVIYEGLPAGNDNTQSSMQEMSAENYSWTLQFGYWTQLWKKIPVPNISIFTRVARSKHTKSCFSCHLYRLSQQARSEHSSIRVIRRSRYKKHGYV